MLSDPGVAVVASMASDSWTTAVGGGVSITATVGSRVGMLPAPGVTVATRSQLTAVMSAVTAVSATNSLMVHAEDGPAIIGQNTGRGKPLPPRTLLALPLWVRANWHSPPMPLIISHIRKFP